VCQPYRHGCDILLDEENELDIRLVEAIEALGKILSEAMHEGLMGIGSAMNGVVQQLGELRPRVCESCLGRGQEETVDCKACQGRGH
jgi:hypothetical protein